MDPTDAALPYCFGFQNGCSRTSFANDEGVEISDNRGMNAADFNELSERRKGTSTSARNATKLSICGK
jgi:hypothetical protein